MTRSTLSVQTPDGAMPAHLWLPEGGTGPGVLLLQEIFGVSAYVERRAQDLADEGYVVLAPEIFWRQGVSRVEEGPDALEEALGLLQRTDWPLAVADGVVALEALRGHEAVTGRVGIVGFCFGGGLAFNVAAQSPADALVSYYGSALPELLGVLPFDPSDVTLTVIDPARGGHPVPAPLGAGGQLHRPSRGGAGLRPARGAAGRDRGDVRGWRSRLRQRRLHVLRRGPGGPRLAAHARLPRGPAPHALTA